MQGEENFQAYKQRKIINILGDKKNIVSVKQEYGHYIIYK